MSNVTFKKCQAYFESLCIATTNATAFEWFKTQKRDPFDTEMIRLHETPRK